MSGGRIVTSGRRFRVFDEVLPDRDEVDTSFLRMSPAPRSQHTDGGELLRGQVLRGRTRFRPANQVDADAIAATIRSAAQACDDLIGEEGRDWLGFTITPWRYGVGASLGWHNDGASRDSETAGAFVWYVHEHWDAAWSGDLLLLDEPGDEVRGRRPGLPLGQQILTAPPPIAVMPAPNRLAVFSADTYHCVRRVEDGAASSDRASLTGFFLTRDPR